MNCTRYFERYLIWSTKVTTSYSDRSLVWSVFSSAVLFLSPFSHLHAGAGWTGVGAISNGGMVEPGQGVNGTVLTNQAGMSAAGYHTHWSQQPSVSVRGHKDHTLLGKECIRCARSVTSQNYSVSEAGTPFYQLNQPKTSPTARICKCKDNYPHLNTV